MVQADLKPLFGLGNIPALFWKLNGMELSGQVSKDFSILHNLFPVLFDFLLKKESFKQLEDNAIVIICLNDIKGRWQWELQEERLSEPDCTPFQWLLGPYH